MIPHALHNKEYLWSYNGKIWHIFLLFSLFFSSFNRKYLKLIYRFLYLNSSYIIERPPLLIYCNIVGIFNDSHSSMNIIVLENHWWTGYRLCLVLAWVQVKKKKKTEGEKRLHVKLIVATPSCINLMTMTSYVVVPCVRFLTLKSVSVIICVVLNRNTYKAAKKQAKIVDLNYTAQGQRKFIVHEIVTLWAAPF